MIRIFIESNLQANVQVCATEKQIHYLFHVMRLGVGHQVLLFNGVDGEWMCDITELNKKRGIFMPVHQTRLQEDEKGATLAFSLIKKDNMDLVLQKATELGVRRLIPLDAERSVIHQLNADRAQMILIEAAEQCERLTIPVLEKPMTVATFLAQIGSDETVVYLAERGQTSGKIPYAENVCFAVGPEGGWTDGELNQFQAHKEAISVNLGRLILRAETSCISILACARFEVFGQK